MLELPYNQFTGTVQVIKAVGTHIVLTFCQNLPTSQLFSIVLTRHPNELSSEVSLKRLFLNFYHKFMLQILSYRKFKASEVC